MLSPDHSRLRYFFPFGVCRFRPTCSEYACQALERFTFFRAAKLIFKRLIRCHPGNPGGIDEVPQAENN